MRWKGKKKFVHGEKETRKEEIGCNGQGSPGSKWIFPTTARRVRSLEKVGTTLVEKGKNQRLPTEGRNRK